MNESLCDTMSFRDSLNNFVTELLEDSYHTKVNKPKVIRDAILDTNKFYPHEIHIFDTPLVQRLRKIHQTGFAYLLYPSANHNRFEHSLGVTVIADKIIKTLKEKPEYEELVTSEIIRNVRLAGILHDCGHSFFSHISEEIYKELPEIKEVKTKFSNIGGEHEILSWFILDTPSFKEFFTEIIDKYNISADIDDIKNIIVGEMKNPYNDRWISDIIHSAFDSDKLDYLPRDCYFTGLKIGLDFDRILYNVIIDRPNSVLQEKREIKNYKQLIFNISGIPNLEQLLFNKMLLYTSIYHHHKIRTLECMIKSIFEIITDEWKKDSNFKINGRNYQTITDFLSTNDEDLFSFSGHSRIEKIIQKIKNRDTLKRCFTISRFTLESPGTIKNPNPDFEELLKLNLAEIRELREMIVDELNGKCKVDVHDIWIDLPEYPKFDEPGDCIISITEEDQEILKDIFPIDGWLDTYSLIKWKGHIFCPPEYIKDVSKASHIVFKDFGLKFNEKALTLAKVPNGKNIFNLLEIISNQ